MYYVIHVECTHDRYIAPKICSTDLWEKASDEETRRQNMLAGSANETPVSILKLHLSPSVLDEMSDVELLCQAIHICGDDQLTQDNLLLKTITFQKLAQVSSSHKAHVCFS